MSNGINEAALKIENEISDLDDQARRYTYNAVSEIQSIVDRYGEGPNGQRIGALAVTLVAARSNPTSEDL